ncbi:aminoacylase-1 isoform X2 [Stomoxys calcitrans]|uniref:aminoacylase-1 isoform X2 n=1 Tax=Stomoxys calcitrans TaxID=35570 RepID=UPI0027E2C418|nr:aminoacylase-1 isoform X2 [Stomoxys calcitrans]
MSAWEDNEEIKLFREYLRIPSVHPDIDYEPCVKFLSKQFDAIGLPYEVHYIKGDKTKPILIGSWIGTQPELPSILLSSHMDVVPVFEEKWTHPPFSAHMDEEGKIFARGSQDMKSVGMQYLAALKVLRKSHKQMRRTVHIAYAPDEEVGGMANLEEFLKTEEFRKLNVGFALDEGIATEDEKFVAFYAERSIWEINFKFHGTAGHGSLLLPNTAGQKLHYLLNKLMAYRSTQQKLMEENPNLYIGDVTTINLTQLQGGVQSNVVPPVLAATFDMRLAIDVNLKEFEEQLKQWCNEAGGDIEWEWLCRIDTAPATKIDETNAYWVAFAKAFKDMDLKLDTHVCWRH